MNDKKIFISSPHMGGNEQKLIQEAFDTNWIAPMGPNVSGFESDLENYIQQNKFVATLSSGTGAIHLGLILLGVKEDDEVICQSMTFSASANPILYVGATPIFIDSELDTWNLCPIQLEIAIIDRIKKGTKPKAIIAVHLYGMPYKIEEIRTVADRYEIPIVEDSAEALGSSYKGQKCGTFGDIGVFSFNGNKIITSSGGGAIITPTLALKQKAIFLATQSRDPAVHFQHNEVGFNYRLSNICASIGRGQMEVLEERVFLRIKMHAFYVELFDTIPGVIVYKQMNEDYFSNYWLSTILIDPIITKGIDRQAVCLAFEAENIESRPLFKPMHLQPIFCNYPYYGKKIAETLFENGLCLPSGSNLTDEDRLRIKNVVYALFNVNN